MTKHAAANILSVLDRCCDTYTFPMLDNGYVYLAATRLMRGSISAPCTSADHIRPPPVP